MPACVTALTVEHAADEAPGARGTFFFSKVAKGAFSRELPITSHAFDLLIIHGFERPTAFLSFGKRKRVCM